MLLAVFSPFPHFIRFLVREPGGRINRRADSLPGNRETGRSAARLPVVWSSGRAGLRGISGSSLTDTTSAFFFGFSHICLVARQIVKPCGVVRAIEHHEFAVFVVARLMVFQIRLAVLDRQNFNFAGRVAHRQPDAFAETGRARFGPFDDIVYILQRKNESCCRRPAGSQRSNRGSRPPTTICPAVLQALGIVVDSFQHRRLVHDDGAGLVQRFKRLYASGVISRG